MSDIDRRQFVGTTAATGLFTIIPRTALGGPGRVAPSDKITLAHIGMGTQSINELGALLADPAIQIVAVCDPNTNSNDYIEWGKGSTRNTLRRYIGNATWRSDDDGCPGGRDVGREAIDAYYARQRSTDKFRGVKTYSDFREMLEKEKDVDAVKVMTPDHLHATVAIAAMRKGKHVMMHKPLANRMYEARLVMDTARKSEVATHLLAWGSGGLNGRIATAVKQGAIGRLREVHNWSNRPVWPQYTEVPKDTPPPPKGFDWDLWLGPSLDRPYHPHYTHTVFRGWYEFGGGAMADMGIYSLWPVLAALEAASPVSAEASPSHTCEIVNGVSRPAKNDFSYPAACTMRFKFTAKGDMPAFDLFWYDGGMRPRLPEQLEAENAEITPEGILFIGDKGFILADFRGANARLYTAGKREEMFPQEARQRRAEDGPSPTLQPWIAEVRGGARCPGSFLNAGPIMDTVTLGTIALRTGKRLQFDAAAMRITNVGDANRYMHREYRKGWEL
jgi:predicted dehydrogenase